jgi:hypothetical protein
VRLHRLAVRLAGRLNESTMTAGDFWRLQHVEHPDAVRAVLARVYANGNGESLDWCLAWLEGSLAPDDPPPPTFR